MKFALVSCHTRESTERSRTLLQRQIAATDAEIDRSVYRLYGLSEDVVKVVEGKQ